MQIIEVGVERMIGGVLGGVGMVRFFVGTDVEGDRGLDLVRAVGNREAGTCGVDETDGVGGDWEGANGTV